MLWSQLIALDVAILDEFLKANSLNAECDGDGKLAAEAIRKVPGVTLVRVLPPVEAVPAPIRLMTPERGERNEREDRANRRGHEPRQRRAS